MFDRKNETYKIIGCCMEVHKTLGFGFLEAVYQESLEEEFKMQEVPYFRECPLQIYYKNILLKKSYIADFVCFENIVVELKAVEKLTSEHIAQVLNYLNAVKCKIGLLINFGSKSLEYKRLIY